MKLTNYEYGSMKEFQLHELIEDTIGHDLEMTSRYHHVDYINHDEKIIVELKAMRKLSTKFDKVCINLCKLPYVHEMIDDGYTCYFFWNFTDDKTYYLKYDKDNKYNGHGQKYCYVKQSDCELTS